MTDYFKDLISTMQAAMKEAEAQRERLDTIAATIRVNALCHGATDDQVNAFLTGKEDFIAWIVQQIHAKWPAVAPAQPITVQDAARVLLGDKAALEVLARAYDREDSAQRGEADPHDASMFPVDAEWTADRVACATAALRAIAGGDA